MFGRVYDAHRHTGRMTQDSSMRMTNKAEVGFGVVGIIPLIILVMIVFGVFV